jgi:ASPIC and UnbV
VRPGAATSGNIPGATGLNPGGAIREMAVLMRRLPLLRTRTARVPMVCSISREASRSGVRTGMQTRTTRRVRSTIQREPAGTRRVLRGEAWMSPALSVRVTSRLEVDPTWPGPMQGFRCARDDRKADVARGAAYGDLDGDGDLDVVIVENGGPARVFFNRIDRPERSVRVRLVGAGRSNRDAIGARVTARTGGRTLTQEVSGGQSYLSAPEKTLTFGLGSSPAIESLEIRWPDGTREVRRDLRGGSTIFVEEKAPPLPNR